MNACPRCRGNLMRSWQDEERTCLQCGYIELTGLSDLMTLPLVDARTRLDVAPKRTRAGGHIHTKGERVKG